MITLEGHELLTLELAAGELYELVYDPGARVDIYNISSGSIIAAYTPDPADGNFIEIPPGSYYNSLSLPDDELYIRSDNGSRITIVRAV